MKTFLIVFTAQFLITLLSYSSAFAHGEEKPGPHQGHIRMPGAFHTELVGQSENSFKVYFLDIRFQNPSIEKTKLNVKFSFKGKTLQVPCEPQTDSYLCTLPETYTLKKGKLFLNTSKDNNEGREVSYALPLTFHSQGH